MELADQQNSEAGGTVAGAEIPVSSQADGLSPAASNSSPVEKQEKLSLRDQINKSVEAVRTEEAKRARDAATGKFTKLEASAEKPAAATDIPKATTEAKPEASPADAPPSAWKAIWESMTPEARALAVKREGEVAKGFDEYRSKTAQLQEITQALDPIRPVLQQAGITSDAAAVKSLLAWENAFRDERTRVQAFHNLARQYGVDLSTLVQSSSQAPSHAQDIPEPLRPVIDQFGNIVQKVDSVEARLQSWEQQQTSGQIAAFAKDKPHFEKVSALMGRLMMAGSAQDLDSAYQQAIKIHPEVSAQIEAERVAKESAERERVQAEKAAAARKAAVSPPVRSPHGGAPAANQQQAGKQGVRDSILSAVTQLREGQRA